MMHRPISVEQAEQVLQILKDVCGYTCDPYNGEGFKRAIIAPQPDGGHICNEYRFIGALGFGGKFRNNGNRDNTPYVDCYRESETPARLAMMATANKRLAEMFKD